MNISKELRWLFPFLHTVKEIIPRISTIKDIKTIRTSTTKRDRMYGELVWYTNGTKVLKIRTKYQYIDLDPLKITIKPLSKIDILHTLAHELSHLYHDTHTPEHKLLENQILTVFMYKLKEIGYISEEEELKK